MNFIKYHSLENDFIIIESARDFTPHQIQHICHRRQGIGADGVLVLHHNHVTILNSDGSIGNVCLNGLRCIAHHILTTHNRSSCTLYMAHREYTCTYNHENGSITTTFLLDKPDITHHTITIDTHHYAGYIVNIGNPHFIVFDHITSEQLDNIGPHIEAHATFPHHTNVEFVWHENDTLHMRVHERGCGQTPACSSGATALLMVLAHQKNISFDHPISVTMPGGTLTASITSDHQVSLHAPANFVFSGTINF